MTVFGFCDAKSKHEVYTKEEANEKFYTKDDYAVIEVKLEGMKFTTPTTGVIKLFDYPEGFNVNNTVVISKHLNSNVSFGDFYTTDLYFRWDEANGKISYFEDIYVQLSPDDIEITVESSHGKLDWSDYAYKVVLMKYKD